MEGIQPIVTSNTSLDIEFEGFGAALSKWQEIAEEKRPETLYTSPEDSGWQIRVKASIGKVTFELVNLGSLGFYHVYTVLKNGVPRELTFQSSDLDWRSCLADPDSAKSVATKPIGEMLAFAQEESEDGYVQSDYVKALFTIRKQKDWSMPEGWRSTTEVIQHHADLLNCPEVCDVDFAFTSTKYPTHLCASSGILRRFEYFEALLSPHFSEGLAYSENAQPSQSSCGRHDSEAAALSTSKDGTSLDDTALPDHHHDTHVCNEDAAHLSKEENLSDPLRHDGTVEDDGDDSDDDLPIPSYNRKRAGYFRHRVKVSDASPRTYSALLLYLYSGHVIFNPLRSNYAEYLQKTSSTEAVSWATFVEQQRTHFGPLVRPKVEGCSPRSMYILADRLLLPDLKELARRQYLACLTIDNFIDELASPFASEYEALEKDMMKWLQDNWKDAAASERFRTLAFEENPKPLRPIFAQMLASCQWPTS